VTARPRSRSLVSLLALLAAVAIVASSAVVASASTYAGPETRVRANAPSITTRVGLVDHVVAGRVGRATRVYDLFVSATGVATETGGGALRSVDDVVSGLDPGMQAHVRTVGSQARLQSVYDDLARGGAPAEWPGYKGTVVRRPDGVEIGIRPGSTSGGATVDIRLPDGTMQKIHVG